MSGIDELNAEYGFGSEFPAIGSPEMKEEALNAADLPSLVPETSPFSPPTETVTSVPTGLIKSPSVLQPAVALAPTIRLKSILQTAQQTMGMPGTIDQTNWEMGFGLRTDMTPKGPGFLGTLQRPGGGVSTELSIGVNFDGQETQIPTLIPTLTTEEKDYLLGGGKPTQGIVNKAVDFAKRRIAEGKGPFAEAIVKSVFPERLQESAIDQANRELGLTAPPKFGETRDTQGSGFMLPSTYDLTVGPEPEKPKKGLITEALHSPVYGVAQLGQIAGGLLAVAGDTFKSDAITNLAKDVYDKATKFMEPFAPTVSDIREIGGVSDALHWAISSVGQMLPFMIGTMGAGGAISRLIKVTLGPTIVKKAATSAIEKGLANLSVQNAMTDALTDLGIKAGYAGMAAASVGAETGIIASDRMTNGLKVLSSDLLWAIPAGFLDVLPEWRLAAKMNLFGKNIARIVQKDGIEAGRQSFVKEFLKQGFMEGITEGWQEILEEAGAGRKPFTYDTMWQAINSFAAAGLAGGLMGAGTNLLVKTPTISPGGPMERQGPPNVPLVGPEFGAYLNRPELAPIGQRIFAPTQPALPGAQGFNLVTKPESILRKAWNIPPESTPEIYTLQEGRYRPPGQPIVERPGWMTPIEQYQDMLHPTRGEGFVTTPLRQQPPGPLERITRGAQDIANSAEFIPLREFWNKMVMGTANVPEIMWGGKLEHLFYDERQGVRGMQSPWTDTTITPFGHIIFTDFDGGKLESLFDKGMKTGSEFIPINYTDPNGDTTILRKGQPLPQHLMDTINTYLSARNKVLGGPAIIAETPPPQITEKPGTIVPPRVEGVQYIGVQNYQGFAPNQYMFNDLKTGSSFVTDDITTEAIMRGRNRKRAEFGTVTPLVINLTESIDQGLAFDILQNQKKQPPPATPIVPVAGVTYSTGQEVTFKRDDKIITGTFNEINADGTLSLGNRPGETANMWDVHPNEIVTDIPRSGKIAPIVVEFSGGETKSGVEVPSPEKNVPSRFEIETSAPLGSNIIRPTDVYANAKPTGNVWIRQEVGPQNNDRVLLVQFSTNLINPIVTSPGLDRVYYDKLYSGVRDGFVHPADFWEIPEWIAIASSNLPNSDVYVIRNIDEAVKFLNEARYGKVAFSALNVNADMIADIARRYKGEIAIGGYVDLTKYFGAFDNVTRYDKIDNFVSDQGFKFFPGTNYRHFQTTEVIPRLVFSTGCLSKCSFCDVKPHGRVIESSPENIRRQLESIKKLNPELVYISDKTFGQASNYKVLQEANAELRANDPKFKGFVIQTTATQFNKLTPEFLKGSGIQYVELGVETFNDNLLKEYRKPHRTNDILQAFQKARDENILVIPNVIIGLKGETSATHNNTIKFLQANQDIISHVNAYNLAIYAGTDLSESIGPLQPGDINENMIRKSWIKDPRATQEFSDKLFNFGIQQLDKTPEQLRQMRTAPASALSSTPDRIPGFARHMVFDTDGRLSLKLGSVEEQITHRIQAGRMDIGAIPGLIGEVWVDANTNEVYSQSMYDRKLRGEDVHGIPIDSLDGIKVEGWKNEIAKIDPKFDISERVNLETPRIIGMSREAVQKIVTDLNLKIPEGIVNFQVLNSRDEIPPEIFNKLDRPPGDRTKGMYIRSGTIPIVYVFANNNANSVDVGKTVFHEIVGHLGFEKLIGPERLTPITKMVHELYSTEDLAYLYRRYGVEPGTQKGDYMIALEKVAEIAETNSNPGLWTRIKVWFQEMMSHIFGNDSVGKLTENEIKVYLWRSRELLQQENIPSMADVYNTMTRLISLRIWNMNLPDGPIGIGSSMREDSSPSSMDAQENMAGWRSWFEAHKNRDRNFGSGVLKDLGVIEAIGSLPHWISMRFPSFKSVAEVQWNRQDKRNNDRLHLMQDPKMNTGDNPYISQKNTEVVDKLIIWSDQNDFNLLDEEQLQNKSREINGRDLTPQEVSAYHGWKDGFDRAIDYAIGKLRQSAMRLYSDQSWFEDYKGVMNNTIDPAILATKYDPEQIKDIQKAIIITGERMTRIDEREKQLKCMNFYAPHVRGKGEYVVRVSDTNAKGKFVRVWVERFENATKAEEARVRLTKDYKGLLVEKTFEPKTTEFVYGGLDVPAMEAFLASTLERAKGKFGVDEVAADKLLDIVFKAVDEEIMARGFRQNYIYRHQGSIIGGYRTENLHQVFFDYMSGLSGSMTKLDATYDFHKALQSIDKVNERGLYEYATRYVRDMLRNTDTMDRKLSAFKTLPYIWYLAANLRLAVTQMFQNAVTAYPILARRQQDVGIGGNAAVRLGKAMTDLGRNNISVPELRMLKDAYEQGETMANYIQEIKGKIEGGWAKTYFMKLIDTASLPFAGMERFNRRSSLLAAFRMYTEAGKSYEEAFGSAKEFVRDAHYAYGLSNYPQLLRDGTPLAKISSMAYVFKSFPHNYVLSMLNYAKDKEGKLALGVMMRSVAMLAILGGLTSIPFLDDILEEYEQQFGDPVRSKMRMALKKYGSDILGQVGMEGLPALAGLDMSGSVKMQIPIPGVGQFDPSTFTMGVWGGLIDKGKRALDFAANSQWSRMVEAGAPMGIEMAMKAVRLTQEGMKTTRERQILGTTGQPIMPTPYETVSQVVGFRPERMAEVSKERRVNQNIQAKFLADRQEISKNLRMAAGDTESLKVVQKDIQTYNLRIMKYGGIIPRISMDSLRTAMKPETGYMKYGTLEEGF